MPETQPVNTSVAFTQEQFTQLLDALKGRGDGFTPEAFAEAYKKANTRENATAPMVSVFNPHGETVKPRPTLRCKTLQNGVELDHDTLTWEEIEALNAVPPGEFQVQKASGQMTPLVVEHIKNVDGITLDRVTIYYPSKGDDRLDHRPLYEYLLEVLEQAGKADEVTRLKALHTDLEQLRKAMRLR